MLVCVACTLVYVDGVDVRWCTLEMVLEALKALKALEYVLIIGGIGVR